MSAATAHAPVDAADIRSLELQMQTLSQPPLVMIHEGEDALDQSLANQGYEVIDPVVLYASAITPLLTPHPDRLDGFSVWPPLSIQEDIWESGCIGPGRLNVMQRANLPKTTIFGRAENRAAGTAYVGIKDNIAMLHAMEVLEHMRRKGAAQKMMRVAATWAATQGAKTITLVTTRNNLPANRLYSSLGLKIVGEYHYRIKPTAGAGKT
ncbi:MAG: GNAT family N-acetyltransferase [Pseudoruegeria sp.]